MSQINIQNLTFAYPNSSENVFENVNLIIDTDWKLGLIGRNGRGKTTLLKILLNELEYRGRISYSTTFDYFPYVLQESNKLSIDILQDIYPEYELWEVIKKMEELKLPDDVLYKNFSLLSSGEQTKLLLALLFTKENNFLLIDEPTNHLDSESRVCVKDFLSKQKGFIVVSHDRDFIDSCCDHILSINKNNIDLQKGNFSSWFKNKQDEDNLELEKNEKLKREISRLKDSAIQTKAWSNKVEKSKNGTLDSGNKLDKGYVGHKSAKMMKRSKSIEKRRLKSIEEKESLLKNIETSEALTLALSKTNSEKVLIELKDVSIFYGENKVVENFSLCLHPGEKVALCGCNGCGKSSIIKAIKREVEFTGNIYINRETNISFINQNYNEVNQNLDEFASENKLDKTKFFTLLIKLGFTRGELENNTLNLSAGQKRKVLIAKSLCSHANVFIWDEPLNYIDVFSRIQIENVIKQSNATILFIEHDKTFTENVASRVIYLNKFSAS